MIVISASDFRSKTGYYLSKALTQEVVVRSRDAGSFKLVPVKEKDKPKEDLMTKEELLDKIERAHQQVKNGKCTVIKTSQELEDFFNLFKTILCMN